LRSRRPAALTELVGEVDAVPVSGRARPVTLPLRQTGLLTDIADTTCTYTPRAAGVELSGPVGRR
jgi:hypothetical protein